jgi:hypothetical protein
MSRVILFCIPGVILLIAALCSAFERRVAAPAGIAVVLLYGGSTLLFGTMRDQEDWRGAYAYLAASAAPTDVIAVSPTYSYPALRYHAVAPVASAVLAITSGGRLLQIEDGLGTNRDWDKTYFRLKKREVLASRVIGRRAATHDTRVAAKLELLPGQSVWRVDGAYGSYAVSMDASLSRLDPDPKVVWREPISHRHPVTIRRYRITVPVGLDIQRLVSRR